MISHNAVLAVKVLTSRLPWVLESTCTFALRFCGDSGVQGVDLAKTLVPGGQLGRL